MVINSETGRLLNSSQTDIHRRPSIINTPPIDPKALMNNSNDEQQDTLLDNSDIPSFRSTQDKSYKPFITPTIIQLIFCILGWYCFSLTISLYNKWMFDKSKLNLPFPILITSFHQLLLSILSWLAIWSKPTLKPINEDEEIIEDDSKKKKFNFYLTHILPCAMASAGDIGSGNVSFRFITLTTYTMVKSSSIAFVLLFGVLSRLEKFSLNLLGIVLLMSFGVMLMVDNDNSGSENGTEEHFYLGFSLVLISSCMSGLRWVFTQLLLHKNKELKGKKNPIMTIYQLSPPMFCVLFIIGLGVEGFGKFLNASIWEEKGFFNTLVLLLIPGILVFFMTIFEFAILQRAQVITLSIAGIFKEILTICVSTIIFNDRLTFINFIGLLITLVDIVWYNYYRYQERLKEAEEVRLHEGQRDRFELESV